MSLTAVQDAEWRTRKIDLFSLMTSFIRQLRLGQDLTKVSLPSVLCHPFSLLEAIAQRQLETFHVLFELETEQDPLKRIAIVLKYILSTTRKQKYEKKPYNPVLGETHICYVDHGDGDYTEFVSEQVSHHPPVTAIMLRNQRRGIVVEASGEFQITFWANRATVVTKGQLRVKTPIDSFEVNKPGVPDVSIINIIRGERYTAWEGELAVYGLDSGYRAEISLTDESPFINRVSGCIYQDNDPSAIHLQLAGVIGQTIQYLVGGTPYLNLFLDHQALTFPKISYLPPEFQSDFDSFRIWKKLNEAIVVDDMAAADQEKKFVEAKQRERNALLDLSSYTNGTYFKTSDSDPHLWVWKDNLDVIQWLGLPTANKTGDSHQEESHSEQTQLLPPSISRLSSSAPNVIPSPPPPTLVHQAASTPTNTNGHRAPPPTPVALPTPPITISSSPPVISHPPASSVPSGTSPQAPSTPTCSDHLLTKISSLPVKFFKFLHHQIQPPKQHKPITPLRPPQPHQAVRPQRPQPPRPAHQPQQPVNAQPTNHDGHPHLPPAVPSAPPAATQTQPAGPWPEIPETHPTNPQTQNNHTSISRATNNPPIQKQQPPASVDLPAAPIGRVAASNNVPAGQPTVPRQPFPNPQMQLANLQALKPVVIHSHLLDTQQMVVLVLFVLLYRFLFP